jgi:hypothetical protein
MISTFAPVNGVTVPIPTLFPVIIKSPLPYCPRVTEESANASITGKPAIVFTDINEELKSSSIENNSPPVP